MEISILRLTLGSRVHVERVISRGKIEVTTDYYFMFNFTATILNLSADVSPITKFESPLADDYLEKGKYDAYSWPVFGDSYLNFFQTPVDHTFGYLFAFVQVIPISRVDIFLKIFYNSLWIWGIFSLFLFVYNYFQRKNGFMRMIDFVQLLLGQSSTLRARKIVHRITMTTVMVASFVLMNNLLSDIRSILLEKKKMSFDTYEDLYNSGLQTCTDQNFFNGDDFLDQFFVDPIVLKILNRTLVVDDINHCLSTLQKWKNVSCIFHPSNVEYEISRHLNSDGSAAMEVARPAILGGLSMYFWFANFSPYAMRFHETMQKIEETQLLRWPALVYDSPNVTVYDEPVVTLNDGIDSVHLMIILSIGGTMSMLAFVAEFILPRIKKVASFEPSR